MTRLRNQARDKTKSVDDQSGAIRCTSSANIWHDRIEQDAFDLTIADTTGRIESRSRLSVESLACIFRARTA